MAVNADLPGLYLAAPHGELIHRQQKFAVAKARGDWDALVGQRSVLLSGRLAYGEVVLGQPEAVDVEGFDGRFPEHQVTRAERMRWWPGVEQLYLYPIEEWQAYDEPQAVDVPAGVQTIVDVGKWMPMSGEGEQMAEGKGTVINIYQAGEAGAAAHAPGTGPPGAVEGSKLWTVEDPPKIAAKYSKGQVAACVEAGNAALEAGKTGFDATLACAKAAGKVGEKELLEKALDLRDGEKKLSLEQITSAVYRALEPPSTSMTAVPPSDAEWPRDVQIYDDHVDYRLGGQFLRRKYSVNEDGGVELGDPVELVLVEKMLGEKAGDGDSLFEEGFKPYPSEHAARVKAPGGFEDGSFRSKAMGDSGVRAIMGRLKGETTMTIQSYRFPADKFTAAEAKAWLKEHDVKGFTFEEATGEEDKALGTVWQAAKQRFVSAVDGLERFFLGDLQRSGSGADIGELAKVGFKTFQGPDGRTWLLTWTTNAFEDREGETFRTKAIVDYAERAWGAIGTGGSAGQFDFWHIPGSEFGDIKWAADVGRFLVEAGPFHDTFVGRTFKEFFEANPDGHKALAPEGWGCSQRYWYLGMDRADKVYEWFDKTRTSVLPGRKAANPYTKMEVLTVNTEQKEALKLIGGEELVKQVESLGAAATAELEKRVAFKAMPEGFEAKVQEVAKSIGDEAKKSALLALAASKEGLDEEAYRKAAGDVGGDAEGTLLGLLKGDEETESSAAPAAASTEEMAKSLIDALQLDSLSGVLKGLTDSVGAMAVQVKGLGERVDGLEKDGKAEAEKEVKRTPLFWFRASQSPDTVPTEAEEKELGGKQPKAPAAIANLTQQMMQGR